MGLEAADNGLLGDVLACAVTDDCDVFTVSSGIMGGTGK